MSDQSDDTIDFGDGSRSERSFTRSSWIISMCYLGLAAMGCNKGYQMANVGGQVTLDGNPLVGARVVFEPLYSSSDQSRDVRGPLSSGKTDEEGRYVLETRDGRRGAVVGSNRVRFSTREMDADLSGEIPEFITVRKESLPAQYNRQSNMVFDVPAQGTDEANFTLKSK